MAQLAPPDAEPGTCYAKLIVPAPPVEGHFADTVLCVYTGDESRRRGGWHWCELLLEPPGADATAAQAAARLHVKVVGDTVGRDDFAVKTLEYFATSGEVDPAFAGEAQVEWRAIACPDQLTRYVLADIRVALEREGFSPKGQELSDVRAAVIDFQRARGLPVGAISLETLEALQVQVP